LPNLGATEKSHAFAQAISAKQKPSKGEHRNGGNLNLIEEERVYEDRLCSNDG
jgi:hypothetical protein